MYNEIIIKVTRGIYFWKGEETMDLVEFLKTANPFVVVILSLVILIFLVVLIIFLPRLLKTLGAILKSATNEDSKKGGLIIFIGTSDVDLLKDNKKKRHHETK